MLIPYFLLLSCSFLAAVVAVLLVRSGICLARAAQPHEVDAL